MAKITFLEQFYSVDIHTVFDDDTFKVKSWSDKKVVMQDAYGAGVTILGSDFKYTHGSATAGTATSIVLYSSHHNVEMTVENAHLDARQISIDLNKYGVSALLWTFAAGNDHVSGTAQGDLLQGDYGNDVVSGGKGDDYLSGYSGQDVLKGGSGKDQLSGDQDSDILTGGSGNDSFNFLPKFDNDVITDFDDGHDVIVTTKKMWQHMKVSQDHHDVVLDFGGGDTLTLEHEKAAHITKDDFSFIHLQ